MGLFEAGKYDAQNCKDIMEHRRKYMVIDLIKEELNTIQNNFLSSFISEQTYLELSKPLYESLKIAMKDEQ